MTITLDQAPPRIETRAGARADERLVAQADRADLPRPLAAGWYVDPSDGERLRWWTGREWSSHLAPRATATQPPIAAPTARTIVPGQAIGPGQAIVPGQATVPGQAIGPGQATTSQLFHDESGFVQVVAPSRPVSVFTPQRPSRVGTSALWLLAILPIVWAASEQASALILTDMHSAQLRIGVGVLFALLSVLCAFRDGQILRQSGHSETASAWWVLLTPVAYLFARSAAVRLETGVRASSGGPLLVWLLLVLPAVSWSTGWWRIIVDFLLAAPGLA